ncbi:MAG: hypothetical protein AAF495_22380 [Pseudomonadota bacterium]
MEQRLQPGETVIYRAPRCWEPNAWRGELTVYVIAVALLWAGGIVSFQGAGLWSLIGALAPPLAHCAWVYWRDWSVAALVTNRRLLHRQGRRKIQVTEVPVARVRRVEAELERLRITLDDGTSEILGHPQEAWGLAVALAHSAAIAPPRLASRREILAEWTFIFGFLLATLAPAVLSLEWIYLTWGLAGYALLLPVVTIASGLIGVALGGILAVFLLRPFLGFEEVARSITATDRLYMAEGEASDPTWSGRLFLWLAERLYGRPPGAKSLAE